MVVGGVVGCVGCIGVSDCLLFIHSFISLFFLIFIL